MDTLMDLPFTEERVIGGVLHWREDGGQWTAYTVQELTEMYLFEQDCFLSQVL